ncbi:START domain-containing protein [Vibrio pacinii]|uniref:START domain-containing protein n=1 Tax=Vibrio pacinii TaxID=170674 RepID=UPI0005702C8C|nr:START domain-containing protein [Vibrio pacinii]
MSGLWKNPLLALLFVTSIALAKAPTYWQFDSDNQGITIYTREHRDGLVEVRVQMFTPTTYSAFLRLLEDTANVPQWIDNVSHSRVVKQISSNENIVYTQFDAPWPAKDRDMVTYSQYELDALGFRLTIEDAPAQTLPEQQGYIRIRQVKATWTLQKLSNGDTMIEYQAFANPGGSLPDWLVNKLAKESARATFQGLREQLPRYQAMTHPNIIE